MYSYRITADNGIFYYTEADTAKEARYNFNRKMFPRGYAVPKVHNAKRLMRV